MRFSLVTTTLLALALGISCLDYVEYQGIRLDMSALTLNRDIIGVITPALNRTQKAMFPDLRESGSFGTGLRIKNIRITGHVIDENRFRLFEYEYKNTTYKLQGTYDAIYFTIRFEYTKTWLGIAVNWGVGTATISNVRNEILVFFNESDPDVQIPHPWDVKNIKLSSWFAPTDWVQSLLHTGFVPDFHKAVDDAMYDFAHKLLETYRVIEDVFPHDIDLIFYSDIMSVTPTVGNTYLTIAFKTNISVSHYINRKIYRHMTGTVVPKSNFDYCLASELVPDVMDALGKGGYNDQPIEPHLWGFDTNKIRELFSILPSLKERYTGEEEFEIKCEDSRYESVNDITDLSFPQPPLELQYPNYCYITARGTSEFIMIVDIFFRFYYEMKDKDQAFYGHIMYSSLYGFKPSPMLPDNKMRILESHLLTYSDSYSDTELLSPGVRILPNRYKEMKYTGAYITGDEICFHYTETRPTELHVENQ